MSLPHVFIASSSRSLVRAKAIAESLHGLAQPLVWKSPDAFPPNNETLTPLVELANTTDFAVFLFTKDDSIRAIESPEASLLIKPRDNVVFEFGLFYGSLGPSRVFTILEQGVIMPTDLKAMTVHKTFASFPELNHDTCKVELKEACEAIRNQLTVMFPDTTAEFDRKASVKLRATLKKLNTLVFEKILTTEERFRIELAERLVEEARSEVNLALGCESYISELTLEKSFLNRAAHIFGRADTVYATSLDRYSKFWLPQDEPGQTLVAKYIKLQPDATFRLFVFTHPRSAAFHREVLSKHFNKYGEMGGVYLCTLNNYLELFKSVSGIETSNRFLKEDFAFLEYKKQSGATTKYLARLSQNTLEFEHVENRDQIAEDVQSKLERLKTLRQYVVDPTSKILRWGRAYEGSDDRWCAALEALFQPDPPEDGAEEADILHLVFFKRNTIERERELLRAIANARRRLALCYSLQLDQGLIRDIWFGRNSKALQTIAANDEVTGAEVRPHQVITRRYPYCLMVRVDGRAAYQEYLGNKTHHEVRREIQETFGDAEISALLEESLGLDPSMQKENFDELERRSQKYMVRTAYMRDEDLRSLVDLELNLRHQPALRRALQF